MAMFSEESAVPSSSMVVRKRESSFDEPPAKRQKDQFLGFFSTLKWPDLQVKFSDYTINVHRFVMGRRSAWFDRACAYVSSERGGHSEVTLQGDDRVALQAFFYFCYDLPYEDAAMDAKPTAMFYVKVYAVAGKYECEELMETVARKLVDAAGSLWSEKDFASALAVGYKLPSTSKGFSLRQAFELTIGANLPHLLGCPSFRMALTHVSDLAINLLYQNVAASTPVTPAAVTQYQASHAQQKNRGRTIDQTQRTRKLVQVSGGRVESIRLKCEKCDVLITDAMWNRNKKVHCARGGRGEVFLMSCPVCAHTIDSSTSFLRTDEHITVLM